VLFQMLENVVIKGLDGLNSLTTREKKTREPSGILFGRAAHPYYSQRWEDVTLDTDTWLKHIYILGGTGMGKTKLIEFLIQRNILAGNGIALIDPHGDLSDSILRFLAHRVTSSDMEDLGKQLILVEPFDREWAVGFNPLDALGQPFAASLELVDIFRRFWGDGYWGPRMDELLRNSLVTLSENSLTLLETRPLLTHPEFRERLVENVSFGEVRDYWNYRYNPLSEKMQSMYREPVLNKITAFIADPAIYRILGQRESTINFREAMDRGKWILLNLSKGHLKENVRLLGTLFLTKLKQASLSRINIPEESRRPFFVFADEFQNFIGEDIETILSEARKFRLGLTLAHQNLDQLPAQLRSVILSNAGTEVFFRLSHHDATQVSSEMDQKEKHLIEKRLIDFKVGEAYLKIKGQRARLFKTVHVPSLRISGNVIDAIRKASFRQWATPITEVEDQISQRRNLWTGGEAIEDLIPRELDDGIKQDKDTLPDNSSFEEGQSEW
jgi:hypothetical protein